MLSLCEDIAISVDHVTIAAFPEKDTGVYGVNLCILYMSSGCTIRIVTDHGGDSDMVYRVDCTHPDEETILSDVAYENPVSRIREALGLPLDDD